jgi:pimeloyl-ACP methyl ester carboxylesterase
LGFIPYFLYKHFTLSKLRFGSRQILTYLGWIQYKAQGNHGPVLLYIHGSPGGFDQTIEAGENYCVLTPSRPGYLGTDISSGRSPEEQAECFKALIDAMKIEKVFVMGVSGGGPSAMHFAAKYPENTYGLILSEAVTHSRDFNKEDEELINAWDMDLFMQLAYMSLFDANRLASMMLPNQDNRTRLLSKEENINKLKQIVWSIWPISRRRSGIKNDYKQFMSLNIPYESISAPALIIHGDEDKNVDIEHAKFANSKIKDSYLYRVKEGDHMMHATHSEEIEEQIETFISNNS